MTKKDYELIATAILESKNDMQDHPVRMAGANQTARRIASYLAKDNPRFDRTKFLKACGIQD